MPRQPVEIGAEMTGKCFQPVEPADRFERFGVQFDRGVSGKHAGASAVIFLGGPLVRCAVGAEEKPRTAAGGGLEQRLPVTLALEYRQAIEVRPDAAQENRISIVQQMLRRDRRGNAGSRRLDEFHCAGRRDVFEHHLKLREAIEQRLKHRIDEMRFTIEYIDFGLR